MTKSYARNGENNTEMKEKNCLNIDCRDYANRRGSSISLVVALLSLLPLLASALARKHYTFIEGARHMTLQGNSVARCTTCFTAIVIITIVNGINCIRKSLVGMRMNLFQ